MSILILVANSSEAAFYTVENLQHDALQLMQTLVHPESRERSGELTSDRPGHYATHHSARGAFERPTDPQDTEAERFAIELLDAIEMNCRETEYGQVICVVPPHFEGLFKKHVSSHHLPELTYVTKDYTKINPVEIIAYLRELV